MARKRDYTDMAPNVDGKLREFLPVQIRSHQKKRRIETTKHCSSLQRATTPSKSF
jgi:hypothetical protein